MDDRELLTALFEAVNRHDLDALTDRVDPEFVGEIPSSMSPEPDFYRGHDGIKRYFESFWEIVEDLTFNVEAVEDAGDFSLITVRPTGVGRGSGVPISDAVVLAAQIKDGRLARLRANESVQEARAWIATIS